MFNIPNLTGEVISFICIYYIDILETSNKFEHRDRNG